MFSRFKNFKFENCAYTHDSDSRKNSNIEKLKNEVAELKENVKKLSENSQSEAKIKTLEQEVKILKLEIRRLFAFTKKVCKINEDISDVNTLEKNPEEKIHAETADEKIQEETTDKSICEEVSDASKKTKFKCDMCGSHFQRENHTKETHEHQA